MSESRVVVEKKPNADVWFIIADGVRVGATSDRKEAVDLAIKARERIALEEGPDAEV